MEQLIHFLQPVTGSPFYFTQANFWIFFGIVLMIFSIVYKKVSLRNSILLLAGLLFFYKVGGLFILVFIVSLMMNYSLVRVMDHLDQKHQRKCLLLLILMINIGLLVSFKYLDFFLSLIHGSIVQVNQSQGGQLTSGISRDFLSTFTDFMIPVGISFFTFQLISYSVEVYRRKIKPVKSPIDFGLYISFFPNLISGPLVRPQAFIPQLSEPYSLTREEFGSAGFLILSGLVKKIVFADYLSMNLVSRVFENPHLFTGFENILAIYGYTLQIYFDFSGYTDIAVGVGLLLGFRLPPNFDRPYLARNITEFWKRWHMSLTTWFLNYLFLPIAYWMSGKMQRKSYLKIRTEKWIYMTCILLTFLLCGLWHGAALNFLAWGVLHGIALILHKIFFPKARNKAAQNPVRAWFSIFLTFHFIIFTWIIFRVNSTEAFTTMMDGIFFRFHPELIPQMFGAYWKIILVLVSGYFLLWLPVKHANRLRNGFIASPDIIKGLVIVIIVIFVYQFKVAAVQPFIYFQF